MTLLQPDYLLEQQHFQRQLSRKQLALCYRFQLPCHKLPEPLHFSHLQLLFPSHKLLDSLQLLPYSLLRSYP